MRIQGGSKGYVAEVTPENRLKTESLNVSEITNESVDGNAFSMDSGVLALTTTGSFNGLFYLLNSNESYRFHIVKIHVSGTQNAQWKVTRNPTTGTLISAPSGAITPRNMNHSAGTTFKGTVSYGADGKTITDGGTLLTLIHGVGFRDLNFDGSEILGNNDSLSISCKPYVAGDFSVTVLGYYETHLG